MSPEERQLLASLFDRVRATGSAQRDADAEAFINQSVREQPYAPYFLAQAVLIQEQGMKAAADRIQQLEARVHELEQQGADNHPQAQSGGFLGGLGSLFGGQHAAAARPGAASRLPAAAGPSLRRLRPQALRSPAHGAASNSRPAPGASRLRLPRRAAASCAAPSARRPASPAA